MEMLILVVLCAVVILAIGIGAYIGVSKVMRPEQARDESEKEAAKKQWESLSRRHDPEKSAAVAVSSSDAYKALSDLYGRLLKDVPGSMIVRLRLEDEDRFNAYDLERDFIGEMDHDERKQYAGWSSARIKAYQAHMQEIDQACAAGAISQSEAERDVCMQMADKIHELMSEDVRIDLEAPAADGVHTLRRRFDIKRARLLSMAGEEDAGDAVGILDRYRMLKSAGFRCSLCGRSPVSGARMRIRHDGITGRDICTCDGCAGRQ